MCAVSARMCVYLPWILNYKSYWQDMLSIFESGRYGKIATHLSQPVEVEFLNMPRSAELLGV